MVLPSTSSVLFLFLGQLLLSPTPSQSPHYPVPPDPAVPAIPSQAFQPNPEKEETYDICIYGGTSAGVIAAYTARKMHKRVLLIEPGTNLGGLSTGGLGYTDIGNKYAIRGLSLDFYRRVGQHYGKLEQWIFEPHVAENIFNQYIREANVPVLFSYRLRSVKKEQGRITTILLEPSRPYPSSLPASLPSPNPVATDPPMTRHDAPLSLRSIKAKIFIDCSYEGDLMAAAGVAYTVGREANSLYNETYNGIQLRNLHQFPDGIDPYKTPGDPSSGLLWGISPEPPGPAGQGDKKVQAYNFRLCLTDDSANRLPIEKPDHYDPARYELLLRYLQKKPAKDLEGFINWKSLPHHKTDINNNGPFSTDMIGMNYDYPDADYPQREAIIQAHADYTRGFLYFAGHDERMPLALRSMMLRWGYPKDEYKDHDHFTPQIYVREARRMVGQYVMTQANCEGREKPDDGIGLAAYTMDSHNCQRVVVGGMVKNEGDVQVGDFPPYPISYRALLPKTGDCQNLLVPVCLSASHIAYGSIRMEPVFMELGQSAAIAASLAIDRQSAVQKVPAAEIRRLFMDHPLADNSAPEILVDNDDTGHVRIKGDWITETHECYGFSKLVSAGAQTAGTLSAGVQPAAVRFIPPIALTGSYSLYIYTSVSEKASTHTAVQVHGDRITKTVYIPTGSLQVEGQTSGEWIPAGKYTFRKGMENYIEISNGKADGAVSADAILLIPEPRPSQTPSVAR